MSCTSSLVSMRLLHQPVVLHHPAHRARIEVLPGPGLLVVSRCLLRTWIAQAAVAQAERHNQAVLLLGLDRNRRLATGRRPRSLHRQHFLVVTPFVENDLRAGLDVVGGPALRRSALVLPGQRIDLELRRYELRLVGAAAVEENGSRSRSEER